MNWTSKGKTLEVRETTVTNKKIMNKRRERGRERKGERERERERGREREREDNNRHTSNGEHQKR